MRIIAARLRAIVTLVGLAALAALAAPSTTSADMITFGASDAYGVSTHLSLTATNTVVATATVAPTPSVSGTAPLSYTLNDSLASLSASQGVIVPGTSNLLSELTSLMTVVASSNVDNQPGFRFAQSSGVVNNLDGNVLNTLGLSGQVLSSFLSISATSVTSNSRVEGTPGSLTAIESAPIENLKLNVNGVSILNLTGTGMVNFAPNTLVSFASPVAGLSVLLNEQILTGDGFNSRGITTNAIHVRFAGVATTAGTLTGDLIIAHSSAQLRVVPEPGSLALLGCGGLAMAGLTYRRRKARLA